MCDDHTHVYRTIVHVSDVRLTYELLIHDHHTGGKYVIVKHNYDKRWIIMEIWIIMINGVIVEIWIIGLLDCWDISCWVFWISDIIFERDPPKHHKSNNPKSPMVQKCTNPIKQRFLLLDKSQNQ